MCGELFMFYRRTLKGETWYNWFIFEVLCVSCDRFYHITKQFQDLSKCGVGGIFFIILGITFYYIGLGCCIWFSSSP